jgi:hypothetical protein
MKYEEMPWENSLFSFNTAQKGKIDICNEKSAIANE